VRRPAGWSDEELRQAKIIADVFNQVPARDRGVVFDGVDIDERRSMTKTKRKAKTKTKATKKKWKQENGWLVSQENSLTFAVGITLPGGTTPAAKGKLFDALCDAMSERMPWGSEIEIWGNHTT
jgi:hypothetical protein